MTHAAPDPIREDLDRFLSNYTQLAARVQPAQGIGSRRPQPSSRPPLEIRMVSHMEEGERLLAWWNHQACWLLDPHQRVELTKRLSIHCPHCDGELVAYLWPERPDRSEIICQNLTHAEVTTAPSHWPPSEWKRLGVLLGTHEDGRFTIERDSGAA